MKVLDMELANLSDSIEIRDLDFRGEDAVLTVCQLSGTAFVNVFSPMGSAHWNMGLYSFANESFDFSQRLIKSNQEIPAELCSSQFIFCGDLVSSLGSQYFVPKATWHRYSRRHLSVSLPINRVRKFVDFLTIQEKYFTQSCFVKRDEENDLSSFGWAGQRSAFSQILSRQASYTNTDTWDLIKFLECPRSEWKEIESYWIDPCPVLVNDDSLESMGELGEWLFKMRLRLVDNVCSLSTIVDKYKQVEQQLAYSSSSNRWLLQWQNFFLAKMMLHREFMQIAEPELSSRIF